MSQKEQKQSQYTGINEPISSQYATTNVFYLVTKLEKDGAKETEAKKGNKKRLELLYLIILSIYSWRLSHKALGFIHEKTKKKLLYPHFGVHVNFKNTPIRGRSDRLSLLFHV